MEGGQEKRRQVGGTGDLARAFADLVPVETPHLLRPRHLGQVFAEGWRSAEDNCGAQEAEVPSLVNWNRGLLKVCRAAYAPA